MFEGVLSAVMNVAGIFLCTLRRIHKLFLISPPPISTHLLSIFFLDRLEISSEVHGHFVLGAQQRAKDGISRHTNASEIRPLEFPPEVQNLDVQVFNLIQGQERWRGGSG